MRLAEYNDQGSFGISFDQLGDPTRHAEIAPPDAAHVVAWVAVHSINRDVEVASGFENGSIAGPIAAPFFAVTDTVEELLLRNLSPHPQIKSILAASENRFHCQREIVFMLCDLLKQFNDIPLA